MVRFKKLLRNLLTDKQTRNIPIVPGSYLPYTLLVPASLFSSLYRSEENANLIPTERGLDQKLPSITGYHIIICYILKKNERN